MESFVVEVREVLCRRVCVVAKDGAGALDLVRDLYDGENVVLDGDDFVGVEFEVVDL